VCVTSACSCDVNHQMPALLLQKVQMLSMAPADRNLFCFSGHGDGPGSVAKFAGVGSSPIQ